MTNEEKYKTVEEHIKASSMLCDSQVSCPACLMCDRNSNCKIRWLALEAEEEKPMPCPFCGGTVVKESGKLKCTSPLCGYSILLDRDPNITIAVHNLVCRAVKAYKESEVKE